MNKGRGSVKFQEMGFCKRILFVAILSLFCAVVSVAQSQQTVANPQTTSVLPSEKGVEPEVVVEPGAPETRQDPSPSPTPDESAPPRRAQPAPFDGVFPGAEYLGPVIGVTDTDTAFDESPLGRLSIPRKQRSKRMAGSTRALTSYQTTRISPCLTPSCPTNLR